VTVYPSSLGGLNYSPSSFDPTTGYVLNNQAETASTLVQKANPKAINKYKIRGDVDNGLAAGTFGYTPKDWHDYGSITAVNASLGRVAWRIVTPEPGRGGVTTTATGLGFAGGGDGILRAFDTYTGNVLWSFQTGFQIAAGPAIYEVDGKEYIAITVGGTPTSSYGGTASQLQIFALKGDQKQSLAPPLRPPGPGPGVLRSPSKYLSAGPQPHTLDLQIVASLDDPTGADTFDGTSHGGMTVKVPKGWKVYVTFANHAAGRTDGAIVTRAPAGTTAAFEGGQTAQPVGGSGVGYFEFTASDEGTYVLSSTERGQAAGGEWIRFVVVPEDRPPQLHLPQQDFAIVAPVSGGVGQNG
jgi:hypothetical protein